MRITHARSLAATLAHKKFVRVCVPLLKGEELHRQLTKKAMLSAFPPTLLSNFLSSLKKCSRMDGWTDGHARAQKMWQSSFAAAAARCP